MTEPVVERVAGLMHQAAQASPHPWDSLWSSVNCTVLRAGTFRCGPLWLQPERVMPCHVMLASRRGSLQYEVAGRPALLPDGGVIVMPPHVAHSGTVPPGYGLAGTEIEVDVVHFLSHADGVPDAPALVGLPVVTRLAGRWGHQVRSGVRRVVTEVTTARPAAQLAANSACGAVLALLWRAAVESESVPAPVVGDLDVLVRFSPVFAAIRERHAEPLRVEDLADLVSLHPVYFASLFKQATGITPMRYLRAYRLGRVRELLAGPRLGLDEIARRTGFGTGPYLARVFRAAEGMPPGTYRRLVVGGRLPAVTG